MKSTTNPGMNRTGLAASPLDAKKMVECTELTKPSSKGVSEDALAPRIQYAKTAPEPQGTMPPPATLKEAANTTLKALTGQKATVLVDKLGERLAFERTGTRLYEGVLAKFDAFGTYDGGPTRAQLERIHQDEHKHFLLIHSILQRLGSDPTAITPSANLHAVASQGIAMVISDPRTNLKECIEAITIAELADNDCWANLVELLRASGHAEMADEAEEALEDEREHLMMVRNWVAGSLASSAAIPLVRGAVKDRLKRAKRSGPNMAAKKKAMVKASTSRKTKVTARRPKTKISPRARPASKVSRRSATKKK